MRFLIIAAVGILLFIAVFRPRPHQGDPILRWTSQGQDLGFPVAVTRGMAVNVQGTNWPTQSGVLMSLHGHGQDTILLTTGTNASGAFSGTFTFPNVAVGEYIVETAVGRLATTTPFMVS